MALIDRVSRLLTADLHAVLDRIEEPEALLRQAIRDMEEELARTEQAARRLDDERAALTARRQKLEASLPDLDGQLDVCFDSANDALARKLVRRKLELERGLAHLADRLEAVGDALTNRRALLAEQREHLDAMRQKAELLTDEPARHEHGPSSAERCAVGEDEVEVAFLRERRKRQPS